MNDDVETLVNNHADLRRSAIRRVEARKKKRHLQKLMLHITLFAVLAACMVILGKIGAVHCLLAAFIYAVSAMAACFTLGMYVATLLRK